MILAVYKGIQVEGNWFSMGDYLWLELSSESSKKVGTDAVLEKDLDSLGSLKQKSELQSNVLDVSIDKFNNQEIQKIKTTQS